MTVAAVRVLDTAALMHLPLLELEGGLSVHSQLTEVQRHAPERALLLESQGPQWQTPASDALGRARELAGRTGDLAGLSPVDLELLALALEVDQGGQSVVLVTDDYRLQNCAREAGIPFQVVLMDGIQKQWKWVLKCRGCAAVSEVEPHSTSSPSTRRTSSSSTSSPSDGRDPSPCPDCGSSRRLVRQT